MTPQFIWQYWHDGNPPEPIRTWINGWAELHPYSDAHPWSHSLFDHDTADTFIRTTTPWHKRTWDEIPRLFPDDTPRKQSDLLRVALLAHYGGIWLDTDMEPNGRTLDPLLPLGPTLCWEAPGVAAIGMVATPPGSPYILRVADNFHQAHRRKHPASAKGDNPTGPLYWTALMQGDVTVLARDTCYPFGWKDWPEPPGPFDDSLMIHHWHSATNRPQTPS